MVFLWENAQKYLFFQSRLEKEKTKLEVKNVFISSHKTT